MSTLEHSVDITQLDLAQTVHSRVLAGHYADLLEALQNAARELGYFFTKSEYAEPMPERLADVLAEAIALRKEVSVRPNDYEGARQRARLSVRDGFGGMLRDEILNALGESGVRLQATAEAPLLLASAKTMRDEPPEDEQSGYAPRLVIHQPPDETIDRPARNRVPLTVDITKDEVVVSGEGSLATYNWKPDAWGSVVKRLSIRVTQKRTGGVEEDVYSVVAGEGEESSRKNGVLADDLSHDEAVALIKRIQDGVKKSLGITGAATHAVELDVSQAPTFDSEFAAERARDGQAGIGSVIWSFLRPSCLVVACIAVLCVLAFGLPVAYEAGKNFAREQFYSTDADYMRPHELDREAMLPADPEASMRPLSPLSQVVPVPQIQQKQITR
jgi:hypothetical protein